MFSEVFGAAEDDAPEMDHSEDSENGELTLKKDKVDFCANTR